LLARNYGTVIPAMVTPFDKTGAVDLRRAGELAERLVQQGADGLLVGGTTGESPTLTTAEKLRMMEVVVDAVGDQVFVWAGTGSNSTASSIELTQEAERIGVDGIMLVTPYYNKPPQHGLVRHFKLVADKTQLPVMLYNVPGRTSRNMEPETVAQLAMVDNIVAIKEASGNLEQVSEIRLRTPPEFIIYSGDDSLTLPILATGGTGVVSVAGHLVAGRLRKMVELFVQGDVRGALRIHLELYPLMRGLFMTTNPIPVKAALRLTGFPVGGCRPPLADVTTSEEEALRELLRTSGFGEVG